MKDIFYIVRDEIVERMDPDLQVKSFAVDGTGQTWTFVMKCSVKWARIRKTLTDTSDNLFTITAVNYTTNTITATAPADQPYDELGTLTLEDPYFFIGTPLSTNAEWLMATNDERLKTPFIWMVEPTAERMRPEYHSLERESDLRIVFLDSHNSKDWVTKDAHDNRLQSLYNMADEFVNAIRGNLLFDDIDGDIQIRNFTRFGTETQQGFDANIIDADLTGIELRLTLPVLKQSCNC